MCKPKFYLDAEKDTTGYAMINRAGSVLSSHGLKKEAKKIHKEARENDYDIYIAYSLLKKYLDV